MTQFAIIKKLTAPDKAEVEVLRGTACGDDCAAAKSAIMPARYAWRPKTR